MVKEIKYINDELLWKKLLDGDHNAYRYIYRKYIKELFAYGMRFTSNRELLKDCIQEMFIKIYTNSSNLNNTDNIKLYLFIALKNILFNVFEKEKSSYHLDTVEPVFSVEYTIEDEIIANEQEQERNKNIHHLLEMLTPRQKEVIYYRYVEGLTMNEICQIMDMNYQSVQNLLQRSIKRLHNLSAMGKGQAVNVRMRYLKGK